MTPIIQTTDLHLEQGRLSTSCILALDLGTTTGWALRGHDGLITSGTTSFRPGRFDGGGMRYLRFTNWLAAHVHANRAVARRADSFLRVAQHARRRFGGDIVERAVDALDLVGDAVAGLACGGQRVW